MTIESNVPLPASSFDLGLDPRFILLPEELPQIDHIEIEDGKPLDSIFQEKQHRLLTEPLFASWPGPGEDRPFLVLSDVGLFFTTGDPPLVPDVMLSLDVVQNRDLSRKEHRSYFLWVMGKPPNVVFEFVSDRRGGEASYKLRKYADLGIGYYVLFDPKRRLSKETLKVFYLLHGTYRPFEESVFPSVGLGVVLWEGVYEGQEGTWLRWCDTQGRMIPTGKERGDAAEERVGKAEERAGKAEDRAGKAEDRISRLAAKLRELGIDPDKVNGT